MQEINWRLYNALILLLCILPESHMGRKERFPISRTFLVYKTNSISGRSCTCPTPFSCSCCENVIILYTKAEKQLCVNFTYQTDGLNVNITLNSGVIKQRNVTEYKPFKICSPVPGSFFSSVCANILELNQFPRSITVCLRTEISTKHKLWELSYNCVSLSTELPMMSNNSMTSAMSSGEMSTTTSMTTGQMPGMPGGMPSGQMPGMPGMPSMPPGQMPGMPSGQMPGMPSMPPGQMPGMPGMPGGMAGMPGGMAGMPGMPGGMPGMPGGMAGMPGGMAGMPGGMPGMPGGMPGMPGGMPGMPGGMPGMPGGMPPGQMPGMPSMPSGQMPGMPGGMPPGQMPGMPSMPSGQMPGMPPMPPGQMPGGMPSMAPAIPAL